MKLTNIFANMSALRLAMFASIGFAGGLSGCAGMNQSLPQSLGINSGARVPPPATGSYATPNSYSGTAGANLQQQVTVPGQAAGQPASNTTSYFNPLAQPTGQIVNSINQAQNQFNQATEQARNSVVRTADDLNNRFQSASDRIDRFNQGVSQASAIMQDAIQAPAPVQSANLPTTSNAVGSGVSPQTDPNDAWRKPNL